MKKYIVALLVFLFSFSFVNASILGTQQGGTGIGGSAPYVVGDTLYSSGATTISKLGIGNSGDVLTVNGGVPVWLPSTGGSSFGQTWEINGNGQLAPTTSIDVFIPQNLVFPTNDPTTRIYVDGAATPQDNISVDVANLKSLFIENNGIGVSSGGALIPSLFQISDPTTGIGLGTAGEIDFLSSNVSIGHINPTGLTIDTGNLILNSSGFLELLGLSDGCLSITGTVVGSVSCSSGGSGTVTSVDMTVPTGLSVSGNPVTTSGTLAVSLSAGYTIPLSSTLWATTSANYYASQFRDWSLQGSPLYLAPTTSRPILVNNSTSTITNLLVVNGTTTNATSTALYTSSQTDLSVLGGNVAIGTTSQASKLVVGTIGSAVVNTGILLVNPSTSAGTGLSVDFMNHTNTVSTTSRIIAQRTSAANSNSTLQFQNFFGGSLQEAMRVSENGYLGIGTTTPASLLDIDSAITGDITGGGPQAMIQISRRSSNRGLRILNWNGNNGSFVTQYTQDFTTWNDLLAYDVNNGRIGIGTTSPTATLDVNGTASSTNLVVSRNATTTNATSTNLFATTASSTKTFGSGLVNCNSASNAITWSSGLFGCNAISSGGGNSKWATSSNGSGLYPNGGAGISVVIGTSAGATSTNGLLNVTGTTTTIGLNISGLATTTSAAGISLSGGCVSELNQPSGTSCYPYSFSTTSAQALGTTTISNIPAFNHLRLYFYASSTAGSAINVQFNGDQGTNYNSVTCRASCNGQNSANWIFPTIVSGGSSLDQHLSMEIDNLSGWTKMGTMNSTISGSTIESGGFEYLTPTGTITSISITTRSGTVTWNKGAFMRVEGY